RRRVWSVLIGTLCHPYRRPMTEFPAGPEGLAIPDMLEALVGDRRVDDRIGDRPVPHEGLQGPGINAAPRARSSNDPNRPSVWSLLMDGHPPMPLYGLGPIADFSPRTARIVSKTFFSKNFSNMTVFIPNRADRRGRQVLRLRRFHPPGLPLT